MNSHSYLVTCILTDRVGILRDVSGALFQAGANLTDVRQNVIGGQFVLFAIADFAEAQEPSAVARLITDALPEKEDASVRVRPCDPHPASPRSPAADGAERYVVAVTGPDAPGRIFRMAEIFARCHVNVEDWRHDFSVPEHTLTIGVVTVPATCDCVALRESLREAFREDGLAVSLLHENIFRATNEVGPIAQLLRNRNNGVSRNA